MGVARYLNPADHPDRFWLGHMTYDRSINRRCVDNFKYLTLIIFKAAESGPKKYQLEVGSNRVIFGPIFNVKQELLNLGMDPG